MATVTKTVETNTENNENVEQTENPCKCVNEPPKPKVRPCKQDLPKESASDDIKEKEEHQCQTNDEPPTVPKTKKQFPLKEYLEEIVAPILMDGFQAVLQKLPAEPIVFLEEFYGKRMDKCKKKLPAHL